MDAHPEGKLKPKTAFCLGWSELWEGENEERCGEGEGGWKPVEKYWAAMEELRGAMMENVLDFFFPSEWAFAVQLCFLGWKSLNINSIHFHMYLLNTNHVFSHEHGTVGDIKKEHITQSPQYKGACNLAERREDGWQYTWNSWRKI